MSVPKLEEIPVCDLGEFYEMLDALHDYADYFKYKLEKVDTSNAQDFARHVDEAMSAFHLLSVKGRNLFLDYSTIALAFHNEAKKCYLDNHKIKFPKKGEIINIKQGVLHKKLSKINDELEEDFCDHLKCVVDTRKNIQYALDADKMAEEEHSGDGADLLKDELTKADLAVQDAANVTLGLTAEHPINLD